jgi:uncharacterized protein (TIGR02001 family)
MKSWIKTAAWTAGLVALGAAVLTAPAYADGMKKKYGSVKDEPAPPPAPDWTISYNFAVTSEYVFRGVSQSAENPTVQGGVDVTYKLFYAGIWASGLDFGHDAFDRDIAKTEIDYYAGIKPVLGPVTFDIGVIYYSYPGAHDLPNAELDFFEIKVGASGTIWKDGTLGLTVFYSPEYTGKTGDVWTIEGTFAQVLPKLRDIVPTFSATLGYSIGDTDAYKTFIANGDDSYLYWNAGVSFAFHDRFSIDLRYWDTNIDNNGLAAGFCTGRVLQCDERFVATAKVTY